MIDYMNEVFTAVAISVRSKYAKAAVVGEYTRKPSKFPCVALDEIDNTPVDRLEDSSNEEKFAGVAYRLQVFSNKESGKKAEAREIFSTADSVMRRLGFRRVSYTTTPEIYDSTIYSIQVTYEAIVSSSGDVYSRN